MCNKISREVYIASCVKDGGIYHYRMTDGKLKLQEITRMDRPMYMVMKNQKMYIVLRAPFDNKESGVVVYDIDKEGRLCNPSKVISTKGEVACHIAVHKDKVYCANYISGSVVMLPDKVVQHHGQGSCPIRQEAPHVHYVGVTPDGQYLCATDLGLDSIFVYGLDLTLHQKSQVPDGHGVRHLAFSEDGKWLFAANELMSTVSVFAYENGRLSLIDTCKILPTGFQGMSAAAAIRVKDSKVFVSNRGHNTIAVLTFLNHRLELSGYIDCGGQTPRDFNFADHYLLSANQDSNEVCVLNVCDNYRLVHKVEVAEPVCICVKNS